MSTRVYELAKELGLKSQELLDRIQEWDLPVKKNVQAGLDPEMVERIKQLIAAPTRPAHAAPVAPPRPSPPEKPAISSSPASTTAPRPAPATGPAPAATPAPTPVTPPRAPSPPPVASALTSAPAAAP
ncbi:MAG: translation initiation factor IF-2 N-terminal domain-containing protein, partial [Isosphaeraceae bacterium]|nr:translation initiation factor IF-2 N-terminal domain-containing protein [Isosphaeraceae bacterium]